jgi:alpha-D-xyloside xylohydrolase
MPNTYRANEKGVFSIIPFKYDENSRTLHIGAREGEFPGMLKTRTFEIVWIGKGKPVGLNLDAPPAQSVRYNGAELVVKVR